ncbi:MAG: hypothetical protein Q4A66_06790 [Eubacteriales bacterium]|nr:hypothetical protein [Eubacteriales bacterium]
MKTKNLFSLAVAALVVVLLTVLCITGVQVGKYILIPAADGITRGGDFAKSSYIVFNVKQPAGQTAEEASEETASAPASPELFDKTLKAMKTRAEMLTMRGVSVMAQGESRIRVELPTDDLDEATSILYLLTQPCHVYFTNEQGEVVLEGEDIISSQVVPDAGGSVYTVSFKVEQEALSAWADMTEDVNETTNVYFDGIALTAAPASQLLSTGVSFGSATDASNFYMALQSGRIEAAIDTAASGLVPGVMSEEQFDNGMILIASIAVIIALSLIISFKGCGAIAALTGILAAVVIVYIHGLIPYLQFSSVSFFGVACALALLYLCSEILLFKVRVYLADEDLTGAEAVRAAWRESGLAVLEICGVAIAAALMLQYFFGAAVSGFTGPFAIGSLVALVLTAAFTRPLLTCLVDKRAKETK